MFRNRDFRNLTGFDLKKIEAEAPVQVTAIIQDRDTDQMARIVVAVERSEPHRILNLHPEPIAPPHLNEPWPEVSADTCCCTLGSTLAQGY